MAFNRNQSNFVSGLPAAAWFTRTTTQPDQIYAWQGRRIYRAFKELLAYRTQDLVAPTGRDITMSEGVTTIARGDLERLQTWIENNRDAWVTANQLPAATANSMISALAEAVRGGRMTSGAMTVILWFALSNIESPPRYEELVVPSNTLFPALGVAPDSDPTGLAEMVHWNANGNPPSTIPVVDTPAVTQPNTPAAPAQTGMSTLTIALLIGIPVVLAIIVGLWVFYAKKKTPTSATARELSERYGSLYTRKSNK